MSNSPFNLGTAEFEPEILKDNQLFQPVTNEEVRWRLLQQLPSWLWDTMERYNAIVAGGAIASVFASMPISDFDIYFYRNRDCSAFKFELDELVQSPSKANAHSLKKVIRTSETANAVTFKLISKDGTEIILQVIVLCTCETYAKDGDNLFDPSLLLRTFDYTVCMGGYDVASGIFILYKDFLTHLCSRRMVFNTAVHKYPICSLYRFVKYLKKGFTISGVELIKLALCINQVEIKDWVDFKQQLMGIDTAIFEPITDALIEQNGENAPIDFEGIINGVDSYLYSHGFEGVNEAL